MRKRILALVLILSLSLGLTSTVYAAEEFVEQAVEEPQEAPAPSSEEPSGGSDESPAEQVSESISVAESASEAINSAQVIVTEMDLSTDVLPYLNEAAVYVDGGTLPVAPAAPVASAPVSTETVAPAPAAASETPAAVTPAAEEEAEEIPATEEITGATNDLETAKEILDSVEEPDTEELEEALEKTNEELKTFHEAESEASENASAAIENAEKANDASTGKTEAYEAKGKAENALAVAENRLIEATDAYDEARRNAGIAEEAYAEAVAEREAAQSRIAEAEAALASAKTNTTAAMEALKQAQVNAAKVDERVKELRDNKEELNAIKDQYYASMVYYYRNLLGKDAVYEDDGTLNIQANAQKVIETGKAEKEATSPDKTGMQLNRYLMKLLIDYMISNNENVDPETANIQIGAQESGTVAQRASQGTVFTNAQGEDQTVVTGSKRDINGETVYAGEQTDLYQTRSKQNDNGRTNRIKVTYTDKDGAEHVEYYNYLYKSKKYDDGMDVENGAIYLALVKYNDDTKQWEASAVEDENNFDDYTKLTKALQAIEDLEKYEKARMTVDEAVEKVAQLEEMIASLSIESPSNLAKLEDALDEAREELDKAYEKKHELEGVVEEARKAVAGIDLSRFDVRFVDEGSSEEDSGSSETADGSAADTSAATGLVSGSGVAVTGGSTISPTLPTIPVVFTPITPQVTPIAGLLAESPFLNITEERDLAAQSNNLLPLRLATMPDAVTPDAEANTLLDDQELPGSEATDVDQKHKSWWALILLAFASLTGLHIFKRKEDQAEQEQEQKD